MFKSVFFELGREVVTPGIYGAMESSREFALEIMHAMHWKLGQNVRRRQRDE